MARQMRTGWRGPIALVVLAAAALLIFVPLSSAAGCTGATWTGPGGTTSNPTSGLWSTGSNWSGTAGSPPSSSQDACLPAGGYTVTVTGTPATANAITIGSGVTLAVTIAGSNSAQLTLSAGGSSTNDGTIDLTDTDSTGSGSPYAKILLDSGASLTNAAGGSIVSEAGANGLGTRAIDMQSATSALVNDGTMTVARDLQIDSATQSGTFTTSGNITIDAGEKLLVDPNGGLAGLDIEGGTITDNGAFEQGLNENGSHSPAVLTVNGGTITGAGLVSVAGSTVGATAGSAGASFSGAGTGTYTFVGCSCAAATTVGGTIGPNQTVVFSANATDGGANAEINSNVTNRGTIELTDSDTSGTSTNSAQILIETGDTLTNDGTIVSDPGPAGVGQRVINGQSATGVLDNAADGTIEVNKDLQIDSGQNGTFTTAGNITIASGTKLLDAPNGAPIVGTNPATDTVELDITGGTIVDNGTFEDGVQEAGNAGGGASLKVTGGTVTGAGLIVGAGTYTDPAGSGIGASFSGAGSGTYTFVGCSCASYTTLAGTIGAEQTVVMDATNANGGVNLQVNSNVTNDGTLELTDPDTSGLGNETADIRIGSGDTLTNNGTVVSDVGGAGLGFREIDGALANGSTGTVDVRQSLTNAGSAGYTNNGNWIMEPDTTLTTSPTWSQGGSGTLTTWVDPAKPSVGEISGPTSLNGTLNVRTLGAATSAAQYTLASGTVTGTFAAHNDLGPTYSLAYASNSVKLTNTGNALAVGTTSLPAAEVGQSYSQTLHGSGGTPGYSWALATGSPQPPAGLTVNSNGTITGAPTGSPGTTTFTVKVTDSAMNTATQQLSITVGNGIPIIGTSSLPPVQTGTSYDEQVSASGGLTPYTWSVSSGSLPTGLQIDPSTGMITGTAAGAPGTVRFTVQVSDGSTPAQKATQPLSITVTPAPLTVTTGSLPDAPYGASYDQTLQASGGTPAYSWSLSSGSLPAGLMLNPSTGEITGSPTGAAGKADFTVQVSDSAVPIDTNTKALSITVTGSQLNITTNSLASGQVGSSYNQSVNATGGATPYTWSISQGSLPHGLSLDATTGAITGSPTGPGATSPFTVEVRDSGTPAQTVAKGLSITIVAPPISVTTTSLPGAKIGTAYNQPIVATGGSTPYSWTVSAGTLPPGLALGPGGVISGTPVGPPGTMSFTVKVTDSSSPALSATRSLSLSVSATASYLNSVSCSSGNTCTAVGAYWNGSDTAPLAQTWNGSGWTVQALPTPTGLYSVLAGVSCQSSSSCLASGFTNNPAQSIWDAPLGEQLTGTSWNLASPAKPTKPGVTTVDLARISCTSSSACTAVGTLDATGGWQNVAERWNGSRWSAQTTVQPAAGAVHETNLLNSVSCTSANSCIATGYVDANGYGTELQTLAERWNGTSWSRMTTPNIGTGYNEPLDVACNGATACMAVGVYYPVPSGVATPLVEHWNGTGWALQSAPAPAGATSSVLSGVSCPSSNACTATGSWTDASNVSHTLAEAWNGTSWTIEPTPNPAQATGAGLAGVSCTSTSACMAVGSYVVGGPPDYLLAESWNGSSWSIVETPSVIASPGSAGVTVSYAASSPGTLTATATTSTTGASADIAVAARSRSLVVARARTRARRRGIVRLTLRLSRRARKLLRAHKRLPIVIAVTFKPNHGKITTAHLKLTLTLKRAHR